MQNTWHSGCTMATLDAARPKHIILFSNVTSLKGTVTSYVTSQHHTGISHVTFYYERSTGVGVGVLTCCLSICQVQLYHPYVAGV